MSAFLRGKQAGMQNDLSANILPGLFNPDDRSRYGINSQISCMAFEPVQSLLAVGTNESKFGSGRIYVFGQNRVQKLFVPSRSSSFTSLRFYDNRLISLDTKSEITIWELDTAKRLAQFRTPSHAVCILTDPMLDWCFIGCQSGEVYAYDLDRERMSPFRLPNLWLERDPRVKASTLVSIQLHPRDIGKLLIAYTTGVLIFNFKHNTPVQFFDYHVPPGAPGGNNLGTDTPRKPRVSHALWHPTGTFVLTAHDDGSLVFWDVKDGRIVLARTLYETKIDQPIAQSLKPEPKHPYLRIAWCCKSNPEDSGLIIAGGQPLSEPHNGLSFIDLNITPNYLTSSWQVLSDYFNGKSQTALETPPGAEVVDYLLVPRWSPHFNGAQDPIAIITLLSSGELITLSFPSGYPISPTNQLHPSLSFVHPFVTKFSVSILDRPRWLGMIERRNQGEPILKGGAKAPLPARKFEGRTIVQVAHADSTVRIWDVGHGDEIENPQQVQVDVARALGRMEDVHITSMSMAPNTGELTVGTSGGEVVVYRWGQNKYHNQPPTVHLDPNPGGLTDISARAEPSLRIGLQPFTSYEMMQGPITTVKTSDVGFTAVGSEGGFLSILDLRGPTVIFQGSMVEFSKTDKRSSFLKGHSGAPSTPEWPVAIEFGIMNLDEDRYSSICCFVGTNKGKVITFKLLPSGGGYKVEPAGVVQFDDQIVTMCPIVAETGKPARATGPAVAGLREGQNTNGLLVVVTRSEARIFKPATSKGASKSFDDYTCSAATVTEYQLHGMALVGVFGDRVTRAFSLPGLKELGSFPLRMLDGSRADESVVTEDGDLFCWTGPSELAILDVWGNGQELANTNDILINPNLAVPARPTISNVQWISGTQYVSPADVDLLIGGPDRPPSKRALANSAAMEQQGSGSAAATYTNTYRSSGRNVQQEGWGEYLTRQLNERTEKLNIMGDTMDNAADASSKWAEDAGKYIQKQKRNMLFGAITSKFS